MLAPVVIKPEPMVQIMKQGKLSPNLPIQTGLAAHFLYAFDSFPYLQMHHELLPITVLSTS